MNYSAVLSQIAQASSALSVVPGPVGIVGSIASVAFASAAAIAKAGKDPVAEIKRIHSSDPLVRSVHNEWKRSLDFKFPTEDIYDKID